MFTTQSERDEQARLEKQQAALAEFKKLMPGLKSYATTVIGRRVDVKPGASNSTDGKTIYLRPPIKLAERREHERLVCGDRDYRGNQVCPACEVREDLISGMHHEIAHIVHESFAEYPVHDLDYNFQGNIPKYLGEAARNRYHNWRYNSTQSTGKAHMPALVNSVDPHLGMMWMGLEDVRINRASYEDRPGLKSAHRARYQEVLDNGISTVQGTIDLWRNRPIDHQVMAAILFQQHGCTIAEWHLAPEAHEALADSKIKKVLASVPSMKNSMDAALVSMQLIQRLRQMDLLQIESQDQEQEDDEPEVESGPSMSMGGGDSSGESNDKEQPDAQPEPGGGDGGGDTAEPQGSDGAGGQDREDEEAEADSDSSSKEPDETGSSDESSAGQEGSADSERDPSERDTSGGGGSATGGAEPAAGADQDSPAEQEGGPEESDVDAGSTPDEPADGGSEGEDVARPGGGAESELESEDEGDGGAASGDTDEDAADEPQEDHAPSLTEVEVKKPKSSGSLEGMRQILRTLFGHDEQSTEHDPDGRVARDRDDQARPTDSYSQGTDQDQMAKVIEAMWYLDRVPRNIAGIEVHEPGTGPAYNSPYRSMGSSKMPESLVGKAVTQARIAFSVNARVEHHRNQKHGRIAASALGKRAPLGDPRLFKKKVMPDKRNYAVLIGYDVSMSTLGRNSELIRESVQALAEVCHRIGVDFSVYAHSTKSAPSTDGRRRGLKVSISKVKTWKEKWAGDVSKRLDQIGPVSGNLDGHTLQFYRKQLDEVRATHKILFYFTDGAMPAANYDEELEVLRDEIEVCKKRGYTLLGVGINTNSPEEHGLETVEVDGARDVGKVVAKLQKKLAG